MKLPENDTTFVGWMMMFLAAIIFMGLILKAVTE